MDEELWICSSRRHRRDWVLWRRHCGAVCRPGNTGRRGQQTQPTNAPECASRATRSMPWQLLDQPSSVMQPQGQNAETESCNRSVRFELPSTSLRDARTRVTNQIHALVVSAPEALRNQLQSLKINDCVDVCARFRPGDICDPVHGTRAALKALGCQHQELTNQLEVLQSQLSILVSQANLALVSAHGIGVDVASILLIVAGDNADRLKSEAAFAALCGVSPIQASSGKTQRHRLNRGGDRQGNHALWRIVMVRLSNHAETRACGATKS